ncbi:MAG: hypothetical protein AB7O43_02980 [Hyphomicrobiaceae bacterium]
MTTTQPPADPGYAGPLSPAHVRLLKIAVVVMGAMIIIGMGVVAWRIIYLASGAARQAQAPAAAAGGPTASAARLALPPGATIRGMTLSGNRLAVHYESAKGPAIAIVEVTNGAVISRIEIVPEVPR